MVTYTVNEYGQFTTYIGILQFQFGQICFSRTSSSLADLFLTIGIFLSSKKLPYLAENVQHKPPFVPNEASEKLGNPREPLDRRNSNHILIYSFGQRVFVVVVRQKPQHLEIAGKNESDKKRGIAVRNIWQHT